MCLRGYSQRHYIASPLQRCLPPCLLAYLRFYHQRQQLRVAVYKYSRTSPPFQTVSAATVGLNTQHVRLGCYRWLSVTLFSRTLHLPIQGVSAVSEGHIIGHIITEKRDYRPNLKNRGKCPDMKMTNTRCFVATATVLVLVLALSVPQTTGECTVY